MQKTIGLPRGERLKNRAQPTALLVKARLHASTVQGFCTKSCGRGGRCDCGKRASPIARLARLLRLPLQSGPWQGKTASYLLQHRLSMVASLRKNEETP
ncbi:MAG: hypothetical protein Q8L76_11985, partial [Cypionkella sp.]|nr:hypothetical protein [Cypionkella sp.]